MAMDAELEMLPLEGIEIDASILPPGTILRRVFKGELHEVLIVRPPPPSKKKISSCERARGWWRYRYRGRLYRSLTRIAIEVTGDRKASGNRFFRLRERRGECMRKSHLRAML